MKTRKTMLVMKQISDSRPMKTEIHFSPDSFKLIELSLEPFGRYLSMHSGSTVSRLRDTNNSQ